ncbi:hypothetical protein EU527_03050 [Candidatus Thorarchaeota archaeon]|nr:MAG: hypothetical protein EU527_03050 [Candidatus Thorarchaeota archaeon]
MNDLQMELFDEKVRDYDITKAGGNKTKYSMIIDNRIPPKTRPRPREILDSVNHNIAPISTMMTPEI